MSLLSQLTWPEVGELAAAGATLVVPFGSTEQHGPYLPLSTDSDLAQALAIALDSLRPDLVVAPVVPFGSSGEHAGFPGTLSIGQEAVEHLLRELGRSAKETFAHLLIVSAHGGNAEPLARAIRQLRQESVDVLLWCPQWRGDAHAGQVETSLMLHLRKGSVRRKRTASGNTQPLSQLLPILRTSSVRAVSPNGILGDPGGASAVAGSRIFADLVEDLRVAVASWRGPASSKAGRDVAPAPLDARP